MKTSKVNAVAALVAAITFLVGLTASEAKQQYAWFENMEQAERVVGQKGNLQILPFKKVITFEEAKKRNEWTDLAGARLTKAKKYLVVWDDSASSGGGDGKQIAERPFVEPDPEIIRDVPQDEPRREPPPREEGRGFFGSLFGGIAAVFQPTVVIGGGGGVGFVPDFVPPQRVFVDTWQQPMFAPVCRPFVPVCRPFVPAVPCRQDYWGGNGGWVGGRQAAHPQRIVNDVRSNNSNIINNSQRTIVNNSVRVPVPRSATPTRTSSGPTFARYDQTRDPSGPSRSYGQSRSYGPSRPSYGPSRSSSGRSRR